MFTIPLQPIPNQRLSVRLESALFELEIKTGRTVMLASIKRDGETIVRGVRCLPERPLLPHGWLVGTSGNFYFVNRDGAYPHYTRFGAEDVLVYLTAPELAKVKEARHG